MVSEQRISEFDDIYRYDFFTRFLIPNTPNFIELIYCGCDPEEGDKVEKGKTNPVNDRHYKELPVDGFGGEWAKFMDSKSETPLGTQVGGSHYKSMKIQPIEYCQLNNLGYCESNVVKYVSRWKNKNGVEDLKKARHCIDLLIDLSQREALNG